MAIIPNYSQQGSLLPAQPGLAEISPNRFGADAEAMVRLGGEVAKVGSELMTARKRASEAEYMSERTQQRTIDYNTLVETEKKKIGELQPDNRYYTERDFANRIKETTDKWMVEDVDSAPTGDAQRAYIRQVGGMFTDGFIRNSSYEGEVIAKNTMKNIHLDNRRETLALAVAPSESALSQTLKNIAGRYQSQIEQKNLSADDARDSLARDGREAFDSYMSGMNQTKEGREKALFLLQTLSLDDNRSTDPMSPNRNPRRLIDFSGITINGQSMQPADFIDAGDYNRYRTMLLGAKDSENATRLAYTNRVLQETMGNLERGEAINPELAMRTLEERKSLIDGKRFSDDQYQREALSVHAGIIFNGAMKVLPTINPENKKQLDEILNSEIKKHAISIGVPQDQLGQFNGTVNAYFNKNKERLWAGVISKRNKDAAGAVEMYNIGDTATAKKNTQGGLSDSIDANEALFDKKINAERQLGIADKNLRILSNEDAKAKTQMLLSTKDPKMMAAQVGLIYNQTGRYAEKYFDELEKHGGLPKNYRDISLVPNLSFRQTVQESITSPEIASGLAAAGRKDDQDSLNEAVPEVYGDFFRSVSKNSDRANSSAAAIRIQEMVSFNAKKKMLSNPNLTAKDAAQAAFDEIVAPSYSVRQNTAIPLMVGQKEIDPRRVEGTMLERRDRKWLEANGVQIPTSNGVPVPDRFWKAMKSAQWNVIPGEGGARLEIPLWRADAYVPVLDKNGKEIRVDFIEASNQTSPGAYERSPEE